MLLAQTDLLLNDPFAFFVLLLAVAVSLLVAVTFHEAAHAYAAAKLGDSTAARLGRITLNPKAHLDPVGSVMVLVAGFGWGKPVPIDPHRLRYGRQGVAMVSAAGPMANVALALVFASLFQIGLLEVEGFSRTALRTLDPGAWVSLVATYGVLLNLVLAAFNLLPLPPLDGGGILAGIAPREWLPAVAQLQRYGPIVLVAVVGLSVLTDLSPLRFLFGPVIELADFLMTT